MATWWQKAGQAVVDVTGFGETTEEANARHAKEARIAAINALKEQYRKEAEQKRVNEEAEKYVTKSQMSPEQLAMMEQQRKLSMGEGLMSEVIAQKQAKEADRQMKSMAFARGYNPMAARGAEFQSAEARAAVQAQGMIAAEQEKAQALQDYSNMQQYQQQMQMAGEQAKKNYLMGNQELAAQQDASVARYQSALAEIEARRKAADAQRESQLYSALISGVAAVGATAATGGNIYAGMAAGSAAGALYQGTQR